MEPLIDSQSVHRNVVQITDLKARSATVKAWEHILTNRGASSDLERFRTLFSDDALDFYSFTDFHKRILRLDGRSLQDQLGEQIDVSDLNTGDVRKWTPLHWACARGEVSIVKTLLDLDAEVNARDIWGYTPLMFAASQTDPQILQLLILSQADVRAQSRTGDTALHFASRHIKDPQNSKLLVKAGAEVDCRNKWGNTAFCGAAMLNRCEIGCFLLDRNADINTSGMYGDTPLFEAVYHNRHEFLSMLLRRGADALRRNHRNSSLVHAAALEGDIKTLETLTASRLTGLGRSTLDKSGRTPLDCFNSRLSLSEDLREAFLALLASLVEGEGHCDNLDKDEGRNLGAGTQVMLPHG